MRTAVALMFTLNLLTAQDEPSPADTFGHSRHGAEFDEGPRQAAYLMQGLSPQVHFPVQGLSEEAQRFFDQGICQQHGFWYLEAERSFRQVALLHPDCALAYTGMSIANVEHNLRAAGFAAQAVQREAGIPDRERAWVDAFAHFHQVSDGDRTELQSGDKPRIAAAYKAIAERSKNRDEKNLARDLVRELEAIVATDPDNVEAKAFLIVQIWRNAGSGLEITSHGAVDALLQQLFAKAPLHPAHHFRIHLWDHEKAERALGSAAVLGSTASGIAHQWHMAGHIFDRLGRWSDAAWQQEAAARVDHAFLQRDRVMPYEIHNYGHNQEWLCRSLSAVGRVNDSVALAENMIELPRHPKLNKVEASDDIAGYGRIRLLETLESYECWPDLLRVCTDGHVEPTADTGEQIRRLMALGTACFRSNDVIAGGHTLTEAEALRDRLRHDRAVSVDAAEDAADARKASSGDRETAVLDATKGANDMILRSIKLLHQLRGEAALQRGDSKAALAEFEQAPGTPPWPRALAHLQLGEHDPAIKLLTDALGEKPRVPGLTRLVYALHTAGNTDTARTRFQELRKLAGFADLSAPLLARMAPVAAAYDAPADWRLAQPTGDDVGVRPPLDSLGSFCWRPQPAPAIEVPLTSGSQFTIASRHGKNTLLIFYLGSGCVHCVEQLRTFAPMVDAFEKQGIGVVAIGSESMENVLQLQESLLPEQRLSLQLGADKSLAMFRACRAYDDFEQMPLHAVLLIDSDGMVRWQDISAAPFTDAAWLLAESTRLLRLPIQPAQL